MKFTENIKDSAELLKLSLPELTKHKLAVNPYNYGLMYAHTSGVYQSLTKDLQNALSTNGTLTHEQSLELFKKHIINDLLAVDRKLENSYQTVMSNVSESASKTEQSTGDLEQQLLHSLHRLDSTETSEELKTVVDIIVEKTRQVGKTTKEFRSVLNEAQSEISRLKEELKEAKAAAEKDALTKLHNRRYFDTQLSQAIEAKNNLNSLALILIDVDHFKSFNDNYGHLMGDMVLKAIAQVFMEVCKDSDNIPCRFGGEEFAILLPKTSMRETKILAENTRKKISSLVLKDKKSGKSISNVTASFGLSFASPEDTNATLIERADKALYKAKQDGRNQVVSL